MAYLNYVKVLMESKENGEIKQNCFSNEDEMYSILSKLSGTLKYYQLTGRKEYLKTVNQCFNSLTDSLLTDNASSSKRGDISLMWIKLCLHLYDLTGTRSYMDKAEMYAKRLKIVEEVGSIKGQLIRELFEKHIAGEIDNALSIAILDPVKIKLSEKFGGGSLVVNVSGEYGKEITARFDIAKQPHIFKNYLVEFRIPQNMMLQDILLNDNAITWNLNKRGFVNVQHLWKKGDVIKLVLKQGK